MEYKTQLQAQRNAATAAFNQMHYSIPGPSNTQHHAALFSSDAAHFHSSLGPSNSSPVPFPPMPVHNANLYEPPAATPDPASPYAPAFSGEDA
ncbi:hypothetical protein BOTBODRAFT_29984 [Botryobasidium botryosum FD-172 SS1]|uniref:Uncharacterized protein n=1 Tax=Botryobasidium botryosum (strain FD-172 SS1) TaxID=930990 RepID=A0A067MNM6_BOTB1|nr:hypothetical protein BOTBODRAFT_29984 [Botryobasidium botryosum FD-172 SS1]